MSDNEIEFIESVLEPRLFKGSNVVRHINSHWKIFNSVLDFPLHKLSYISNGNGYLSGSFPLTLLENSTDPLEATIKALVRSDSPTIDGYIAGRTTITSNGLWMISGINMNFSYDIIAEIPGFNGVMVSNVIPETLPYLAPPDNITTEVTGFFKPTRFSSSVVWDSSRPLEDQITVLDLFKKPLNVSISIVWDSTLYPPTGFSSVVTGFYKPTRLNSHIIWKEI